jgi:hypothetical protein
MFPFFEDMFEDVVFRHHMFNARSLLNKLKSNYPHFKHPSTLVRELHNFFHWVTTTRDKHQKKPRMPRMPKLPKPKPPNMTRLRRPQLPRPPSPEKPKRYVLAIRFSSHD